MTISLDKTGCPDLQQLVERAGRRHAASIGEQYAEEPFKRLRPGDGGMASSEKAAAMTAASVYQAPRWRSLPGRA